MNENNLSTYKSDVAHADFNRLSSSMRISAAASKYAEAVEMYAATDMSIRSVAEKCGVTPAGLSAHIGRHHRPLLFKRYGLNPLDSNLKSLKVKPQKGQSLTTHLKYKDAIEACADMAYIEYNVSQVARMFNLDGSALAAQMRVHYPDIIPDREEMRRKLGIADNTHRGARQSCSKAYAEALVLYRDTDHTIPEVARICNVSKSGFCQFLRFYHQDVIAAKSARRKEARKETGLRRPGKLAGNGCLYGPKPETVALYAPALQLYRDTSLTIDEIIEKTEVPAAGFKGYLHQWHRDDKLRRRGFPTRAAAKYAPAIASLKENPRHVAVVAAEFGLNAEVFREYLKIHEPEIAARQGMTRRDDGKLVKREASEKYARAIHEYATTPEPLKSIAERHGIVYNSIFGYIARNCPEERLSHKKISQTS